MIHKEKLAAVIKGYKEYFPIHWKDERYKWEAVKQFQEHWDAGAPDFAGMLQTALNKTANLLASGYAYPRAMLINFARADQEAVRAMFLSLYDENRDLAERVDEFKTRSEQLRMKYDDGTWKSHFQNTNAISVYLWLHDPNRYYIYKYEEFRNVAEELDSDYKPKKDGAADTMIGGFRLYDELSEQLRKEEELDRMLRSALTDSCYPDPELKILTMDVGFYISRFFRKTGKNPEEDAGWFPGDYSPELSVDDWVHLLKDEEVFTPGSLEIMKRMKDYGGQATCTQLSIKYGESANFYNSGSSALAKRIAEKTGCPVLQDDTEKNKWWPVLYVGRVADREESGSFLWRLRSELSLALDKTELSEVALYSDPSPAIWKISHGKENTGISDLNKRIFLDRKVIVVQGTTKAKGVSKVSQGDSFRYSMKKGDFFYLCYGSSIRLLGQVTSDKAVPNPELQKDWYERPYCVIAESKDTASYNGTTKWWTPNQNSTCIKVDDPGLFEELILRPYFDLTVKQLLGGEEEKRRYWWLTASPKIWSFSNIAVGETQDYTLYNDNGNRRRIFQNFLDVKQGDVMIGYEANPVKQIVALAEITKENDGKNIYFKKTESLSVPIDYQALKECPELEKMEFFVNPNGSLFRLTKGEYDFIMDMIREENPVTEKRDVPEPYSEKEFLKEVYMTEERYHSLASLLRNKKNLILQGAPGVGKTYAAKRLAYSMMGVKDDSRVELIQFHQNYSYEDFIMGYKPDGDGFKLTNGIFYRFCTAAANHPDRDYFFIIDEINRGNMSKIFGELLMLIERDYRGTSATLAYSGTAFCVPKNLYLIGMMNTADRSLAMIDYALRRRFSFFEMEPGFHSEGFKAYQAGLQNDTFNALIEQVTELNREIKNDDSLGAGFLIGHSYFCGQENCTEEWMKEVVYYDLIPMLQEYWFDDKQKVQRWENRLSGVFHD